MNGRFDVNGQLEFPYRARANAPHVAAGPPGCYCSPPRTDVMRWVLKPSQCIRPT
jgi:hypothetical protein